jgi:hypothetical protein
MHITNDEFTFWRYWWLEWGSYHGHEVLTFNIKSSGTTHNLDDLK